MQPRSLSDLCLITIRNGVESGKITYLFNVPPQCRKKLFKLALMHGIIDKPVFTSLFSSLEFLNSLNGIIDVQDGIVDDQEFLIRLANTLDEELENGLRLGPTIKELRLNLYAFRSASDYISTNINGIINLISKCPNLKSLHIHALVNNRWKGDLPIFATPHDFGLMNDTESIGLIVHIMENLEELSLTGSDRIFRLDSYPIIQFKQLKSLHLDAMAHIDANAWNKLMKTVKYTLIKLNIDAPFREEEDNLTVILPFPLPKLQSIYSTCRPIGIENLLN